MFWYCSTGWKATEKVELSEQNMVNAQNSQLLCFNQQGTTGVILINLCARLRIENGKLTQMFVLQKNENHSAKSIQLYPVVICDTLVFAKVTGDI